MWLSREEKNWGTPSYPDAEKRVSAYQCVRVCLCECSCSTWEDVDVDDREGVCVYVDDDVHAEQGHA